MIGAAGYLCLDLFPDLGDAPFTLVPGMLREIGAAPGHPGGVIGNTGGALCRLGVPARLGGRIGDDPFGTVLREKLDRIAAGADLRLRTAPGEATGYSIVLNPPGVDRMLLCCRGANDCLGADDFGPEFRRGLAIFHFGYPPLCRRMAERDGAELRTLFAACRREGILTSLDMALPSPGTFSYTLDWRTFLARTLPETDLFCPSVDELRFMLRAPEAATPAELTDALIGLGARAVFLKLGSAGAMLRTADTDATEAAFRRFGAGRWRNLSCLVPPFPVRVVGTTGAGDSAIAGFLAGVRRGFDGETTLKFASRVAACSISAPDSLSGIPPAETIIALGDWQ